MSITVEELSLCFYRWEENGHPVASFLELIPLTKADAESICIGGLPVKVVQM